MTRTPEANGFALLEALIAFGVLAVVAAMFMGVMQSSGIARRHAAQMREATLVARSQLARGVVAAGRNEEGVAGPYRWNLRVSSYPGSSSGGLEEVAVRVSERGKAHTLVELRTLRLAR